jgi:hypothetical protein
MRRHRGCPSIALRPSDATGRGMPDPAAQPVMVGPVDQLGHRVLEGLLTPGAPRRGSAHAGSGARGMWPGRPRGRRRVTRPTGRRGPHPSATDPASRAGGRACVARPPDRRPPIAPGATVPDPAGPSARSGSSRASRMARSVPAKVAGAPEPSDQPIAAAWPPGVPRSIGSSVDCPRARHGTVSAASERRSSCGRGRGIRSRDCSR